MSAGSLLGARGGRGAQWLEMLKEGHGGIEAGDIGVYAQAGGVRCCRGRSPWRCAGCGLSVVG
jgi:hypothetical protein